MIEIKKPIYIESETFAKIEADIYENDIKKTIWFQVEKKYGKYLTWERGDAFLVAILNYAMRNGHDIKSQAPIGEDLYYNLTRVLIKTLVENSKTLYHTKIIADIDSSNIRIGNAVGTGISCGIDSLNALAMNSNTKFKNHNITHLAFNNVGSHGTGVHSQKLYNNRKKLALDFANEYGFEYIENDSNLHDTFKQDHLFTHTYSSIFAVLCLQKLYKIYYYASAGYKVNKFSLIDNEKHDNAKYELLLLQCLSSNELTILSEGCALNRFEKTINVTNYPPSYKYLNVCLDQLENCGKCSKCKRTLLTLDALNKLDEYKNVFDIEMYKSNTSNYYAELLVECKKNNDYYKPLYQNLKYKIKTTSYLIAPIIIFKNLSRILAKKILPNSAIKYLKSKNDKSSQ